MNVLDSQRCIQIIMSDSFRTRRIIHELGLCYDGLTRIKQKVCRLQMTNRFRDAFLTWRVVSEAYENELENMNVAITAENQSLQYDNKQLNALIKEYEQTLETLMSTFRNRAVWFYDYFFTT
jgi:hypothetical protein